MNDPYSSSFNTDVLKTRLDAVQAFQLSGSSTDMAARIRDMQAASLLESQLRMQRMQQDMLRTIQENSLKNISQQSVVRQVAYTTFASLPGALPGTAGLFNRNVGYTASGAYTQNFGGLLADAGIARYISQLTGGALMPGYARQAGASVIQVQETAREELAQRAGDFGRGFLANATPDAIRARLGLSFIDKRGDFARKLAATLSTATVGLGDDMRADNMGARLRGNTVQLPTLAIDAGLSKYDARLGYSLTSADRETITSSFLDEIALNKGSRKSLVDTQGRSAGDILDKLIKSLDNLTSNLKVDREEAARIRKESLQMGMSNRQLMRLSAAAGGSLVDDGFSPDQRIQVLMRLWSVGRSGDYGTGQAFASRQYGLANAIRERLTAQGEEGMAELFRFGGSNPTEAALAYQTQRQELGRQFARGASGRSLGLASVSGSGWMSGTYGGLMSDISSAYSKTPFAYMQAIADPNTRMTMEDRAEAVAYRQAEAMANMVGGSMRPEDRQMLKIRSFSNAMGVDFVRASEMVRRREAALSDVGGLVGRGGGLLPDTALMLQDGMAGIGLRSDTATLARALKGNKRLMNAATGDFTNAEFLLAAGGEQRDLKREALLTDILGTPNRETDSLLEVEAALKSASERTGIPLDDLKRYYLDSKGQEAARLSDYNNLTEAAGRTSGFGATLANKTVTFISKQRANISASRGKQLFSDLSNIDGLVFDDKYLGGYLKSLTEDGVSNDNIAKEFMAASAAYDKGYTEQQVANLLSKGKGVDSSVLNQQEQRLLFQALETYRTKSIQNTESVASVSISSIARPVLEDLAKAINGK